uniref:Uncharacterized protein n=1 Tax=Octopus bimaculoides TaxID=37653 RepID=A0A0L8GTA6_OCTBM
MDASFLYDILNGFFLYCESDSGGGGSFVGSPTLAYLSSYESQLLQSCPMSFADMAFLSLIFWILFLILTYWPSKLD